MATSASGRLLVVDDDAEFLSPLCEVLSELGYEVRGCTSGRDALEAIKERSADLLLTDLIMPEMDGITLLRAALEIDPHLVGIIVTGQATVQTAVEAMKVGAFDYVVKPLEFKMLGPLLSRAMGVRILRMENVQLREEVEVYRLKQALQETENKYQKALRSLVSAMPLVEERERRRIAADLHDNIGQTLALSKIKLGYLSELVSSDDHRETVEEIRELMEQSIQYTRSLTSELSPPLLYELGFEEAVESLAEQMQKKHGTRIDFEDDGQPKPLDDAARIVLYKAVRELLVNVVKHSRAHRADVSIRRDGDFIEIIVRDDGVGFKDSREEAHGRSTESGFGLFNIRERLESIEGRFEVDSGPGCGTRVIIRAPLRHEGAKEKMK